MISRKKPYQIFTTGNLKRENERMSKALHKLSKVDERHRLCEIGMQLVSGMREAELKQLVDLCDMHEESFQRINNAEPSVYVLWLAAVCCGELTHRNHPQLERGTNKIPRELFTGERGVRELGDGIVQLNMLLRFCETPRQAELVFTISEDLGRLAQFYLNAYADNLQKD